MLEKLKAYLKRQWTKFFKKYLETTEEKDRRWMKEQREKHDDLV